MTDLNKWLILDNHVTSIDSDRTGPRMGNEGETIIYLDYVVVPGLDPKVRRFLGIKAQIMLEENGQIPSQ